MKKDEWLMVFLPLLTTWYLDRISKMWAVDLIGVKSYEYLHFALHHNPGAMLGLFSDLPPFLRIVTLSTGGAFLVVTYALIQYLLPIKSLILRSGMSILLGGILGNVTDRIVWGHVVDFIIVGTPEQSSPAFNVADALQWVGYIFIVYAIIKEGGDIWPENNARRRFWINPKFQLKYSYLLLGVGLSISFVALVFTYTYMRVAFIELAGQNPDVLKKFLNPFLVTFGFLSVSFSVGLFTVGKIISHKIAGPIYAFEKYMNELVDAKMKEQPIRQFKLRTHDEFKELEGIGRKVKEVLYPEAITLINENQKSDTELFIEEGMDKPIQDSVYLVSNESESPPMFQDPGLNPLKSDAIKQAKENLSHKIEESSISRPEIKKAIDPALQVKPSLANDTAPTPEFNVNTETPEDSEGQLSQVESLLKQRQKTNIASFKTEDSNEKSSSINGKPTAPPKPTTPPIRPTTSGPSPSAAENKSSTTDDIQKAIDSMKPKK